MGRIKLENKIRRKIVLVSNDSDFFKQIYEKAQLRNSDELFQYDFDALPAILDYLDNSVLIINSENNEAQTLDLLKIIVKSPAFVFGDDENAEFKINVFNSGAFGFITKNTSDEEFNSQLKSALKFASSLEQNQIYRNILVENNLISKNNEVFLDFVKVLDSEIESIKKSKISSVLLAISPDDNSKFLIQSNQIETIILNSVRANDVLMNYAPSKYFLLLKNVNLEQAGNIWNKICSILPEGMYAGFAEILNKSRQQVVNEALNKLHLAVNQQAGIQNKNILASGQNFKFFRKEIKHKIEQIVTPVFYHIQQIYNEKLFGMIIEQRTGEGYGVLDIKSNYASASFRLTSPGFSTINIDISYTGTCKQKEVHETKRITLEPDELEEGLLQDLLEQFILEFKNSYQHNTENKNDNT